MVQTRASAPSGRVYSSTIPPRQKKLRDIINQSQRVRRRVSAGPVSSLRQETMTQMGFVFGANENNSDFDTENEPSDEVDAQREQREDRRKRRRTLGESPASRDLLSRKRQSTLTQIGFVEPLAWRDPELEEAGDEGEGYVKREESIPIWEDETAGPEKESQRDLRQRSRESHEKHPIRRDDREVGDSDEEDDLEVEDNPASDYQQDEVDREIHVVVPGKELALVQEEEEIGDSDEESSTEDLEMDDIDQNSQDNLESNSPEIPLPCPTQVQIRSSIGPPVTPRKKRYEIPDSDAESEDISPEKITPIRTVSSQSTHTTTPSRPTARFQNAAKANSMKNAIGSASSTRKAPVTFSQATTVDLSQYLQSEGVSAPKTTPHKSSYQDPASTSPFVLRSSQLLTESQMLPASLMGTIPAPPCWIDSDEEDEVGRRIGQGNNEDDDDDDENDEL